MAALPETAPVPAHLIMVDILPDLAKPRIGKSRSLGFINVSTGSKVAPRIIPGFTPHIPRHPTTEGPLQPGDYHLFPLTPDLDAAQTVQDILLHPPIDMTQYITQEPVTNLVSHYKKVAKKLTRNASLETPGRHSLEELFPQLDAAAKGLLSEEEKQRVRNEKGMTTTDNPLRQMREIAESYGLHIYMPEFFAPLPNLDAIQNDPELTEAAKPIVQFLQARTFFDEFGYDTDETYDNDPRKQWARGIHEIFPEFTMYETKIPNQARRHRRTSSINSLGTLAKILNGRGNFRLDNLLVDTEYNLTRLNEQEKEGNFSYKERLDVIRTHELVFLDVLYRVFSDIPTRRRLIT